MARTAETTRTRDETEPEHPAMYRVLLINDHYTTVDFVIWVLMEVFGKGAAEAYKIMLDVHQRGKGLAGIYTRDVAESKADRTMKLAREQGMPFRAEVEPE
ncbi:MAG: ATP-dependent Clp protease adaptor ClpS [Spirochaetes bacterium]|jgi:ATP-dependent Clp protease adaptor protein ClpS|nr:ATP-dependent Clp protease adaptor ClpS [Spirochaetota bacterium]